MTPDWFQRGEKLLARLVVPGIRRPGRPIDYLNTTVATAVESMSREELEIIAMTCVIMAMAGTHDEIQRGKQ